MSVQVTRWVAVIGLVVAIPLSAWAINYGGERGKVAAIDTAAAAASAHGCKLDRAALDRLVSQYRDKSDVGWAESGDTVAQGIAKACPAVSSS